ncbi:MAG: IS1595 family transposase [Brevinematales bacterium]|jgi:transposase-like protein
MQMKELSLLTFQKKFDTIKKCETYLFKQRWQKGYICPVCGNKEYYYIKTRKQYECSKCKHQTSITAGTVMHGTRTSLKKWFWAIYLSSTDKGGISALNLQKKIRVSYPTAWLMLHKIREAMKARDAEYQLAGLVEIDEAYFGGKDEDNKRGRGTNKTKVLVQVSTNEKGKPQFAKLSIIENVKERTVLKEIQQNIKEGSSIKTDGYNAYNNLSSKGYKHETIDYLMKWVHIVISNAKTFIKGTYHGACDEHLQSYLDEFSYRFNRRFWEGQLFNRLIAACVDCETITYKDLTK